MARRKPSTGIPAVAFMAGFSASSGTREIPQPPTRQSAEQQAEQQAGRGAVEPELPKVGSAPATPSRDAETPFTCPDCGAHEAYLLRDGLLRVTKHDDATKVVEVEPIGGEQPLALECRLCRCVVELDDEWTVVETEVAR